MTSSTSINILSNALYDKKNELTDKEYIDTYQLLTTINNVNNNNNNINNIVNNNTNNVNNDTNNNNRELRNNIFVITIIIINFLIGLFIYITFNRIITHTCKNQVTILNNVINICNITQPLFDENKCNYKIYYCNHITNKMNTYDNLCMPIVSTCFKQINITKYNIIRIIISVYCSILLGIALRIIARIMRKYIYPINRVKYNIFLLCLLILLFISLIWWLISDNNTIMYIFIGVLYLCTFSLIMHKYFFI